MPCRGGVLLCMPAADATIAAVKTITVHPGNRDLPVIQGTITVLEAATGRLLGVLDGPAVTARRHGGGKPAGGPAPGGRSRTAPCW